MIDQATAPAKSASDLVIGAFPLNSKDFVRAAISEFNGNRVANFRKWFADDSGAEQPTKKGIAFAVRHLPAFAQLVKETLAKARAAGMISEDAGQ